MPATIEFFPFDDQASYEDQWRAMAQTWRTSGILVQGGIMDLSGGDCAVEPGTGLEIKIAPGHAWIKGHYFKHTDDYVYLPITPNSSGSNRSDLVVLRADFTNNTIGYEILEGTTTPVQTTTIWDLPLAAVRVANGASAIAPSDITDLRVSSNHVTFRPMCILRHSFNSTLANNTTAFPLTWNTVEINNMGMYSPAEPDVITIRENGIYEVKVNTIWSNPSGSTGTRRIIVFLSRGGSDNAIAHGSAVGSSSGVDLSVNASRIIELQRGDYLFVLAYNQSGASVDIRSTGLYSPIFSVVKIGVSTGL